MKKYIFLVMLLVGLMACTTAPPPVEQMNVAEVNATVSETQTPVLFAFLDAALTEDYSYSSGNSLAKRLIIETNRKNAFNVEQVQEVPDKYGDLVIRVDDLSKEINLYASLSAGYQPEIEVPDEVIDDGLNFLQEHWIALLIGILAFGKIVVNLTPTEKDNKVFAWLDSLINSIIPNLKKGGGTHATPG